MSNTDLKTSLLIALQTKGEERVRELQKSLLALGISAEKAEELAQGLDTELNQIAESSDKAQEKSLDLAMALKTVAGAAIVREFVQANASLEAIEKSLEAVTGSAEAANEEMEFIRGEASRLGVETSSAAASFLTLAAATKGTALEGEKTREVWSAVAGRMTELGATSADVAGAMTQLAQGASKGKFELEDLKSIAERIPGFFSTFADAIGVTNEQFFEMVSRGEITADLLPKLAAALAGTGGEINTFNATLGRLKNSFTDVMVAIGDTGIFDAITWSMGKLADATSYATLGFKAMAAQIKGDEAAIDRLSNQAEQVRRRLFGLGEGAKQAKVELEELGKQAEQTGVDIERSISEKIVGSLIRLTGAVKSTDDAFKNIGLDPEKIQTGISQAERLLIESFKKLASDPNVNGQVLLGSLLVVLDQVGKEAIPEIGFAYKTAAKAGRQSTDELASGMGALKSALAGVPKGVDEITAAYKTLGIASQATLKGAADGMRVAYEQLVRLGVPIEDQRAGWAKWAEAAIASNGGVADTVIVTEAAMHGYRVEVDETGKAVLRLTDAEKLLKQIQAEREEQQKRLLAQLRQEQEELARVGHQMDALRGGIGSVQGTVNQFSQDMQAMGEGAAWHVNAVRQQFQALGPAASATFETMLKGARDVFGPGGLLTTGPASPLAQMREKMGRLNSEAAEWTARLKSAGAEVRDIDGAMAFLSRTVIAGYSNMEALGREQLEPLRAALADAQQRLADIRDEARDTLASLRDELDQLEGDYTDIEARRAKVKLMELEAKLAEAKAAQDQASIAALGEAIRLQERINALRLEEARQRERQGNTSGGGTTGGGGSATGSGMGGRKGAIAGDVTININGDHMDPDKLARYVVDALDRYRRFTA